MTVVDDEKAEPVTFLSRARVAEIASAHQADPETTALLDELAGETTDTEVDRPGQATRAAHRR